MHAAKIAVLSLVLAFSRSVRAQQRYHNIPPLSDNAGALQESGPVGGDEDSITQQSLSTTSETIVSLLSTSGQHTILLHLLQRAKCIPLLAHIESATVFAPTDTAWQQWASSQASTSLLNGHGERAGGWLGTEGLSEWQMPYDDALSLRLEGGGDVEEKEKQFDNQNWALRQHLLYHMLNYTLSPATLLARPPDASGESSNARRNVTTLTTLLFPLAREPDLPPIPEPGSPWLPRGGQGMLGGRGQRLRLARAGSTQGGERGRVGTEWDGRGGVGVWNGTWGLGDQMVHRRKHVAGVSWASNGVVVGVEGVLEAPRSIEEIIRSHPSLSYLSSLLPSNVQSQELPPPLPANLSDAEHLTIFAPANVAFDRFDAVEKRYLEGDFGAEAITRVLGGGVVDGLAKNQVGWVDFWGEKADDSQGLRISTTGGNLLVNGTAAEEVDIFASNGVIHIVPDLLVPSDFVLLNNAERVLLSLNATRFVSLLRSANLSSTYAGDTKGKSYTILAPTDDVLDTYPGWGRPLPYALTLGAASPKEPDSPLAALLKYHIIPSKLAPDRIKDTMLLETELQPRSLGGRPQRLRVDISNSVSGQHGDLSRGELRLGGVAVQGRPVASGDSVIYLLSSLLSPPDDVLQTAVSELQLSTFIAAIYAAELDHTVLTTAKVSYFAPRNKAFNALGLAMQYLLLPEGKDELRKILKYHAIDQVIYSAEVRKGKETYQTLHGGHVVVEGSVGNASSLSISSPPEWSGHDSGGSLPANGEIRPARLVSADTLTSTGVIHVIDSVVMPADVSIGIDKLLRGSRQTIMADLMIRAGLSWVLEGREPTFEEVQQTGLEGVVTMANSTVPDIDELALPGYVVLAPSDIAFSRINMTAYLSDPAALLSLLKQHIIPTQPAVPRSQGSRRAATGPRDGRPLSLEDNLVYQTLLSASSKYGELALRATGDNSFLIGVRGARGGSGANAARVGDSGRASVRWRKSAVAAELDTVHGVDEGDVLWRGGVTLGGGVVIVDSVLIPFEPSWLTRWGRLVIILSCVGALLLAAGVFAAWWFFVRAKVSDQYEPLEGEEED